MSLAFLAATSCDLVPGEPCIDCCPTDGDELSDNALHAIDRTGDRQPLFEKSLEHFAFEGVAAADFNGDGARDLAIASFDDARLAILSDFAGARQLSFRDGLVPLSYHPRLIALDADDDGDTDVLVLGDQSSIAVNNGAADFRTVALDNAEAHVAVARFPNASPAFVQSGQGVQVRRVVDGALVEAQTITGNAYPLTVVDVSGDGLPDIIASGSGQTRILRGRADGLFDDDPAPHAFAIDYLATANGPDGPRAILDGDDVLERIRVVRVNTDGTPGDELVVVELPVAPCAFCDRQFVALVDLDGDGVADPVIERRARDQSEADVVLALPDGLVQVKLAGHVAYADLDGDGADDVVDIVGDVGPGWCTGEGL